MNNVNSNKDKVFLKISNYLKKKYFRNLLKGLLQVLTISLIIFFFLTLLESFFYFSPLVKKSIWIIFFLTFLSLLLYYSGNSIRNLFGVKKFSLIQQGAKEIGDYLPEIKDNLLNSIQIISNNETGYSKDLANAAFGEVFNKIKGINFQKFIDLSPLKKILISSLLIFIFAFLLLMFIPQFGNAANRFFQFNTEFKKPVEFSLTVLTGNKKLRKGENLSLEFKGHGKVPENISVLTKSNDEIEFSEHIVKKDSNNLFILRIRNIKNSIAYLGEYQNIVTDTFRIQVTTAPVISKMEFTITPPFYSQLPAYTQENDGNITALKGSNIKVNIQSTKELSIANMVIDDLKKDSLSVNNKFADGSFRLTNNDKYYFEIIDIDGNKNDNPIEYNFKIIPDEYPEIEIRYPEQISLVPSNDIVNITYSVKDDYGFTKSLLFYSILNDENQVNENDNKVVDLQIDKEITQQDLYYNWDLATLGLRENQIVSFYIQIFDNDNVSGPKSVKSPVYKLRVPSLDELFAQANEVNNSAVMELSETLKEAEELQKEFEEIEQELKQNEKQIDWTEKERIEESVKNFEKIANKIENVQEKLENMRKQMTENNMLSKETMEKYNELQELMDELDSNELRKALEKMQKSLENLTRDDVQKALNDLALNEEMFQKSIERTLNLLKRIQVEQKVDEIIKRTEKIVEDLEKLQEETKKNANEQNNSDNKNIADEQNDVNNQLNSLENEMQKLQEKMSELNDMPKEKMDELNKQFNEQQNEKLSEEALKDLQENNPFDALKKQNQLSQNMNSMMQQMQQMQKQMQQQSQQAVMENMLKAIDNIIGLSKEQESLNNQTKKAQAKPTELSQMAKPQMEIRQNLDNILKQLSELSQKTFAITPEMGEALGKAKQNMSSSIEGMQNKSSQRSTFNQEEAMKNLNEAATFLQNSLQAMMQGGGQGGGMMSLMQQLQQMAQQQMGLNKLTQMMKSGQLSMEQQAQLQRLAHEQAAIQKSLQELNKEAREAGQSKKLAADLDNVLKEMNEVIAGLNTKKVDDELIKKQEKILSKLLDAQRSINERDFEKNRESFTGKDFDLISPENLILNKEKSEDFIKDELIKAKEEGYSKDYQDLIKKYFENLKNKINNN